MKPFKSLLCCLAAAIIFMAIFSPSPGGIRARALATRYARADARNIYFYTDKDLNSRLFTIPETYCVEILSEDGDWYFVRYAEDVKDSYKSLYGYVRMSDKLTPVNVPPENIYLVMTVPVTYHPEILTDPLKPLDDMIVQAAFYGTYYSDEATAYSYVYFNGSFGYILGANDDYPRNEIVVDTFTQQTSGKGKSANTKLIAVLAVSAVAVVTLIVLYVLSRKRYFIP